METLTALLLATPVFGFSLTPPASLGSVQLVGQPLPQVVLMAPGFVSDAADQEGGGGESTASSGGTSSDFAALAEQGRRRMKLRRAHRVMGILTWVSMTGTLTLGALQFVDEYGSGDYDETRCASGDPLLGQWNCDTPFSHLFSVLMTTSLYASTFGLSLALGAAAGEREGRGSTRLRMHKALRWVHFAGMCAQIVEGLIFANLGNMGVDERENHGVLRGLNTLHLVLGSVTWATLTWAGAMMLGN